MASSHLGVIKIGKNQSVDNTAVTNASTQKTVKLGDVERTGVVTNPSGERRGFIDEPLDCFVSDTAMYRAGSDDDENCTPNTVGVESVRLDVNVDVVTEIFRQVQKLFDLY